MLLFIAVTILAATIIPAVVSAAASTRRAYSGSMYANLGRR